jgi:signal peptidase I
MYGDDSDHERLERDGMVWPPASWEAAVDELAAAATTAPRTTGAGGMSAVRDVLQTLVLTAVLFVGARLVVQNYIVESVSMQPTLYEGQFFWVDKLLYRIQHGPHRGDIVVFQSWGQDKPFVKRVVGLPGETLAIHDGRVFIDDQAVAEPYLTQATDGDVGPLTLGANDYYVMGDNRGNSGDSRIYGTLPRRDIIGRAWLRYWPLNQVGLLNGATRPSFASDP